MTRHPISVIGALAVLALPAACKPPASDEYMARGVAATGKGAPSAPITSPDTTNAMWAPSQQPARLLYGIPGQRPLLTLSCIEQAGTKAVRISRYAAADPHAQAIMAIVGNGHASHLPVDAVRAGKAWMWEGTFPAGDPALEPLTGQREAQLTIPGAGMIGLNPSPLPATIIEQCRGVISPPDQSEAPLDGPESVEPEPSATSPAPAGVTPD